MKMFSVLIAVFLFVGCKEEVTYQTIKVKKQYSVELPSFLTKTDVLNKAASLQYQNIIKEFYVLVIDEPKKEVQQAFATHGLPADFTSYSDAIVKDLKASLQNADFSEIESITINGMDARTFSVTGYFDNIPIYYEMAHIQSRNNFYQVLIWTSPARKEKYSVEMKKIITSFKEFSGRAKK